MFSFSTPVMTNPSIFWTQLRSNAYGFVKKNCAFPIREKRDIVYQRKCSIFVVYIRPARTFLKSNCLPSLHTLDWSRNLLHNPMWNMAVNNILYSIYPISMRTEKSNITKCIPFFFDQYMFLRKSRNPRQRVHQSVFCTQCEPSSNQRFSCSECLRKRGTFEQDLKYD